MNVQPDSSAASPLSLLAESLVQPNKSDLQLALQQLLDVAAAAREAYLHDLADGAQMFAAMLNVIGCDDWQKAPAEHTQLLADIRAGLADLDQLINQQPDAAQRWDHRLQSMRDRWSEYLDLVEPHRIHEFGSSGWSELDRAESSGREAEDWPPAPSDDQIRLLLSAVSSSEPVSEPVVQKVVSTNIVPTNIVPTSISAAPPPELALVRDQELLDAYLDDAQRCIVSMEQIVLALAAGPQQGQQLRQLCRELHTLKGASGSVGFHELAGRMHQLEDVLERCAKQGSVPPDQRMLLNEIDSFRQQIQRLTGPQPSNNAVGSASTASPLASNLGAEHPAPNHEETLRVKASQVDRLMDMLAELVMLRNRRDSRVEQMKEIHGQLLQYVSRLRSHALHENRSTAAESGASSKTSPAFSESLGQTANELLDLGRKLRDLFEPMAEEQRGISRFIGQFRQELTELRRLPVAGLFHRLQRAVHDAAQSDDKRVRIRFIGEQTGLERSLQERLYEPLLHVVRNAVSHGIETSADRLAAGKDSVGTITLEARGGTNLLSVTVRDDGRGLNYDALRRRGLELGLIDADRSASPEELAQLIFRPGFSTTQSTTHVSGRGVGMDVVASTLERLHGWVEVESEPGKGTQIRLLIPRRSVIEHAMVFRAGGQLLALPMQFVNEIAPHAGLTDGRLRCGNEELTPVHFSKLFFSDQQEQCASGNRILVLASSGQKMSSRRAGRSRIAILVDDVVGPQEVVVRPLPLLLRGHPLLSGVSLSATGEIVLLLDSQRLFDWAVTRMNAAPAAKHNVVPPALVVDDSSAARQRLVRALNARGLPSEQAQDGLEALECLREHQYSTVWLDLEMPRMDGFELLENLRREAASPAVPVVIVSSRNDEQSRQRAAELGAVEFLAKPATDQDVARVLATLDCLGSGGVKADD